jgi:hypothetical protein
MFYEAACRNKEWMFSWLKIEFYYQNYQCGKSLFHTKLLLNPANHFELNCSLRAVSSW